jgi:integrase
MDRLVAATTSERWKAAVGLAAYGGLRLGEVRGLRWADVDLAENTITVCHSLLPDGIAKNPKSELGFERYPFSPRSGGCSSDGGSSRRTRARRTT